MRGQSKNNADTSNYGGRQNHQKGSIFPNYLRTYNIHHISRQNCFYLSPALTRLIKQHLCPRVWGPWVYSNTMLSCHQHFCSASTHTYCLPLRKPPPYIPQGLHSIPDFLSLQPSAQGMMNWRGFSHQMPLWTARAQVNSGQAGNAIQMSCLLAGRATFISPYS